MNLFLKSLEICIFKILNAFSLEEVDPFENIDRYKKVGKREYVAIMKKETEIKCTGNNGNGCYLDSCGHDCGCEGIKN